MTTPTPNNAARRYYMVRKAGSPEAWGNWFQPAADDVSHYIGNPTYEVLKLVPAATVTALEARIAELEAAIEWVRAREEYLRAQVQRVTAVTEEFEGMTGAGYRYMAANIREALTGAGAK